MKVKVWYDAEGDFLEVLFSDASGYQRETNHDAVMERVDAEGNVIGDAVAYRTRTYCPLFIRSCLRTRKGQ